MTSQRKAILEEVRRRYHRREFVEPDPLQFLYEYDDPADREVVGLIASSLAYGRVAHILRSVASVLERTGPPARFAADGTRRSIAAALRGFKHRFTTGAELAALIWGAGRTIRLHGSLGKSFASGLSAADETVVPALASFVEELARSSGRGLEHLAPRPERGSACKRLNLYLRWMVRSDEVDPGGWAGVPRSMLVVPLDVHMHRICSAMGMTGRRGADLRAALEATRSFAELSPDDPVRYDFALTRLGIRADGDMDGFLTKCRKHVAA